MKTLVAGMCVPWILATACTPRSVDDPGAGLASALMPDGDHHDVAVSLAIFTAVDVLDASCRVATAAALPGAVVYVGDGRQEKRLVTDGAGMAALGALAPGAYTLRAPDLALYEIAGGLANGFEVPDEERPSDATMNLSYFVVTGGECPGDAAGATLGGIVARDGVPQAGTLLTLDPARPPAIGPERDAVTGDSGTYAFSGMIPGDYVLTCGDQQIPTTLAAGENRLDCNL